MVNEIISYLNTRLSLTNLFEFQYGICELVHEKEQVRPMQYCSNGEWKEVSNFDAFNGVSYWRKNGNVTNSEISGNLSCNKFHNIEIPLKLICVVPRSKMTDNAYTGDSIANIVNNQLTESSRQLKSTLNARKVNISVTSYNTDSHEILTTEYDNIQITDLSFKYAYISIDVTVTVEINVDCIVLECDTADACANLLRALTTDEKLSCILPDYDFSSQTVLDSLTTQQQTDLIAALCDGCDAVTIYLSNGTTVVTTVASGGSYTIAKHLISDSAGTTLYNPEFNEDTTVTDSTITAKNSANTTIASGVFKAQENGNISLPNINKTDTDGTVTSVANGVDVTCTPIASLTCDQLNSAVTQVVRNTINEINVLKTGQTTSYRTGDDGDLEKGRLTNFTTLPCNNPFGNTNRFTDSLGAQLYGIGNAALTLYVIDHSTGLGWYNAVQGSAVWTAAIDAAEAFSTHFSDWRMSNVTEINSITNWGSSPGLNYAPFSIVSTTNIYMTSTTCPNSTTFIIGLHSDLVRLTTVAKTGSNKYLLCRNHY